MSVKGFLAIGLLVPCVAFGAAASVHPSLIATTMTDRQQGQTAVITMSEADHIRGWRAIHYHVDYDAPPPCHVVLNGTATINQFRDDGPVGPVALGHPSAALPKCLGAKAIAFEAYSDRGDARFGASDPNKAHGKSAATYHNVKYDYAIDYPDHILVPGNESESGDGNEFTAESAHAKLTVWGKYNTAAMLFEYAEAEKAIWEPLLKPMADSLRVGRGPTYSAAEK